MIRRVAARSQDSNPNPDPVPSLVDYCYGTLTSGACDWQQLETLPQSVLVSMLKRSTEQRAELQARCAAAAAASAAAYLVNPPRFSERLHEQGLGPCPRQDVAALEWEQWNAAASANILVINKRRDSVRSKWHRPIPGLKPRDEPARNPYPTDLCYSREGRCFSLAQDNAYGDTCLSRVISSAMLLYRACCLFPVDVNTSHLTDRYKWVWTVSLWHTATGRELVLDECKGAATVNLQWPAVEDKQLSSDFLELMDLLCGDCPHPYDYVLAGCIA